MLHYRKTTRTTLRGLCRNRNRRCVRGRRRGPDDFAQALTAFRRAIRAHRRLARLAPSFFDASVVNRERENRVEQRRWMALWEPVIARAYGVAPAPAAPVSDLPPLPPPRIQRAVDCALADLQLWLEAGRVAMDLYKLKHPHALLSWTRMARYLDLAFDLKKLALGLDSPNPLPEKISYDYEFTDLKRAYGHLLVDTAPAAAASASPPRSDAAASPVVTPTMNSESLVLGGLPSPSPPVPPRCDAWSRWARQLRQIKG